MRKTKLLAKLSGLLISASLANAFFPSVSLADEKPYATPRETCCEFSSVDALALNNNKGIKNVKVTNAVNKRYKYPEYDGTYPYKIPKVTISGKNMKSINNKIMKEVKKFGTDRTVTYSYYIDEKIVSIIVDLHEVCESATGRQKVYNISVKTGKLLSDSDVVKMWGSTDKEFFSKAKKLYKKIGKRYGDVLTCDNPISYKRIDPFIGQNGHLCFTSYLNGIPPVGSDAVMFDTKTEKYSILSFSDYHFF